MNHADPKIIALSQMLFERLLTLYPKCHRQEYGPAIAQNFHDQSLDAWRNGRGFGLMFLWLRVVPDLLKTSILEHFVNLKNGKFMLKRLVASRFGVPVTFFVFFFPVFLLIFGSAIAGVMTQPKCHVSSACILVVPDSASSAKTASPFGDNAALRDAAIFQAQVELLQSDYFLSKVLAALNFNDAARRPNNFSSDFREPSNLRSLRNMLSIWASPPRISFQVYAKDPQDAAFIANAITTTFQSDRKLPLTTVGTEGAKANAVKIMILSTAMPDAKTFISPASRLSLIIAVKEGSALGLIAGGLMAVFVYRRRKITRTTSLAI